MQKTVLLFLVSLLLVVVVFATNSQTDGSYTIVINDISDVDETFVGDIFYTYAQITNSSLNVTNAFCNTTINGINYSMTYLSDPVVNSNSLNEGYYYNTTASLSLTNYSITCNASGSFAITLTDNISIYNSRLSTAFTKEADRGVNATTNETITLIANYQDLSLNPLSGVNYGCSITIEDDGTYAMSYDSGDTRYEYDTTFSTHGLFNFNVSCNDSSATYTNRTVESSLYITENRPFFNTNFSAAYSDIDARQQAVILFTPLFIDSNQTYIVLLGGNAAGNNLKIINGSTLSEVTSWASADYDLAQPGVIIGDFANDGEVEIIASGMDRSGGSNAAVIHTKVSDTTDVIPMTIDPVKSNAAKTRPSISYILNQQAQSNLIFSGTTQSSGDATIIYNYASDQDIQEPGLPQQRVEFTTAYLNNDNYKDILAVSPGTDISGIYQANSSNQYNFSQTLPGYNFGTTACAKFFGNESMDCLIIGDNTSASKSSKLLRNMGNGTFVVEQEFDKLLYGSLSLADYNNDGTIDIFFTGFNNSLIGGSSASFYLNYNGTLIAKDFVSNTFGIPISTSAYDYDLDGDTDISVTGSTSYTAIWQNNMSLWNPNQPPSPPSAISANYSDSQLHINWTKGSDDKTHENALYYNLQIGTTPGGYDILSGLYPISSTDPTSVLGNMQNRRNISFTLEPQSYYVQVQSIDAGLRKSDWVSTSFTPEGCENTQYGYFVDEPCGTLLSDFTLASGTKLQLTENDSSVTFQNNIIQTNTTDVGVDVQYGNLTLENVNLRHVANQSFSFNSSGKTTIDQSTLTNVSVYNYNQNSALINTYLQGNLYAYANLSLENVTINGTLFVFENITLLNTSFSQIVIYDSNVTNTTFVDIQGTTNAEFETQNTNGTIPTTLIQTQNYLYNSSGLINQAVENYTINVSLRGYFPQNLSYNASLNKTLNFTLTQTNEPDWSIFENPGSTNLTLQALQGNLSDVRNLTLNTTSGKIVFLTSVNVTSLNLTRDITIDQNNISVNASTTALNVTANLTIRNLSYTQSPVILKDGEICATCSNDSYANNELNVTVSSFSSYTTTANAVLQVNYLTDAAKNITTTNFTILANYTNRTTDAFLSTATCQIAFDNATITPLTYNGSQFVHTFNYSAAGSYDLNVSCSLAGYETILVEDTITILNDHPALLLADTNIPDLQNPSVLTFGEYIYLWGEAISEGNTSSMRVAISDLSITYDVFTAFEQGFAAILDWFNDGVADLVSYTSQNSVLATYYNLTEYDTITDSNIYSDSVGTLIVQNQSKEIFTTPVNTDFNSSKIISANFSIEELNIGLESSNILSLDINFDNQTDIILSGRNGSTAQTILLLNNDSNLEYNQTPIIDLKESMLASFEFNESHDTVIIAGKDDSNTLHHKVYLFNENEFYEHQDLNDIRLGTIIYGDIDNNGYTDYLISGYTSSGTSASNSYFYLNNGTHFNLDSNQSLTGLSTSSGAIFDYQNDSDLDIIVAGTNAQSARNTHLYISDWSLYTGENQRPNTTNITIIKQNYTVPITGTSHQFNRTNITIIWNKSTDDRTPQDLLRYNIRLGDATNNHKYISGVPYTTSNPPTPFRGNARHTSAQYTNLSQEQCIIAAVQTYDTGLRYSEWNQTIYNQTELCDGYDNDCDGDIDEDFDATSDGLVDQNNAACGVYLDIYPEKADPCDSKDDQNGNVAGKQCTPPPSGSPSGGSTGGSSATFVPTITDDPEEPETPPTEPEPEPTVVEETVQQPTQSQESSSENIIQASFTQNKFSSTIQVEYTGRKSLIKETIKNIQRTEQKQIKVIKDFPKDVLESAYDLETLNDITIIEVDPIIQFNLPNLDYLEETRITYTIPGRIDEQDLQRITTAYNTQQTLTQEEIEQVEVELQENAQQALDVQIREEVEDNQTRITLQLDLKDNVTQAKNVEVEQFIPKCLLEEITDTMLEAGVDPQYLNSVEIKEADPLIVWNFKEIKQGEQISFKLPVLRQEDCEDEIKIRTLAHDYILENVQINEENLKQSALLTIFVISIFLALLIVTSNHTSYPPHINRLVSIIKHNLNKGKSEEQIVQQLKENLEHEGDIQLALKHTKDHHPFWHILQERSLEIIIFITILVLNILDFTGTIPGYIDWVKKIISWMLLLLILYRADITGILFNQTKPKINILLLIAMFLMHVKSVVQFALTQSLEKDTGFVIDLYRWILDHADIFTLTLFFIGAAIIIIISFILGFTIDVREGSLYYGLTHHPHAHTIPKKIARSSGITILFFIFFFTIFNRMMEWLAISIDAAIFILALIILISAVLHTRFHSKKTQKSYNIYHVVSHALTNNIAWIILFILFILAIIKPFIPPLVFDYSAGFLYAALGFIIITTIVVKLRKHFDQVQHISTAVDTIYVKFLKLFKYPHTLILAISGLFILQYVVEIGLYLIPNITGKEVTVYSFAESGTLFSLFTHTSIIGEHLLVLDNLTRLLYVGLYVASLLGYLILFLTPVLVWVLYFTQRSHHPTNVDIFKSLKQTKVLQQLFRIIFFVGIPLVAIALMSQVLIVTTDAQTRFIQSDLQAQGVFIHAQQTPLEPLQTGILLGVSAIAAGMLLFSNKKVKLAQLWLIIGAGIWYYYVPFVRSLFTYVLATTNITWPLSTAESLAAIVGSFLFLDIIIVYILGLIILLYFILPVKTRRKVADIVHKFPPLHHITTLASHMRHLEYYDEARQHLSGNLVRHLVGYVKQAQKDYHLETIIYQLKFHKYPQHIIEHVIKQTHPTEYNITHPEHIDTGNVKVLVPLVRKALKQKETLLDIIEEFEQDYTIAEIKLALRFVHNKIQGELNIHTSELLIIKDVLKILKKYPGKKRLVELGYDPAYLQLQKKKDGITLKNINELITKLKEWMQQKEMNTIVSILKPHTIEEMNYAIDYILYYEKQVKNQQREIKSIEDLIKWVRHTQKSKEEIKQTLKTAGWPDDIIELVQEAEVEHAVHVHILTKKR